jgi:hypothetical protein
VSLPASRGKCGYIIAETQNYRGIKVKLGLAGKTWRWQKKRAHKGVFHFVSILLKSTVSLSLAENMAEPRKQLGREYQTKC